MQSNTPLKTTNSLPYAHLPLQTYGDWKIGENARAGSINSLHFLCKRYKLSGTLNHFLWSKERIRNHESMLQCINRFRSLRFRPHREAGSSHSRPILPQVSIDNIINHGQVPLLGLNPRSLDPPGITFSLPGNPPRQESDQRTSTHKSHGTSEAFLIPRCILRLEDLRSDRSSDLAITVDESDAESRSRCAGSRLKPPGPH